VLATRSGLHSYTKSTDKLCHFKVEVNLKKKAIICRSLCTQALTKVVATPFGESPAEAWATATANCAHINERER
jgi:hypothetical protein